jgi:threonine dehydrogenase-like Zn-dependent dehydrogenase
MRQHIFHSGIPTRSTKVPDCPVFFEKRKQTGLVQVKTPESLRHECKSRVDLTPLVTHRYKLDDIEAAYDLFSHQRDGVLKVAITP